MSRIEIATLIEEKLVRQERPDAIGTLKRCDVEIGNLLDSCVLDAEWTAIFLDLYRQIGRALD